VADYAIERINGHFSKSVIVAILPNFMTAAETAAVKILFWMRISDSVLYYPEGILITIVGIIIDGSMYS